MDKDDLAVIALILVLISAWIIGNIGYFSFARGDRSAISTLNPQESIIFSKPVYIFMGLGVLFLGSVVYSIYRKGPELWKLISLLGGATLLGIVYRVSVFKFPHIFWLPVLATSCIAFIYLIKVKWEINALIVGTIVGLHVLVWLLIQAGFEMILGFSHELPPYGEPPGGGGTKTGASHIISQNYGLVLFSILIGLLFTIFAYQKLKKRYAVVEEEDRDKEEDISETVERAIRDLHEGEDVRSTIIRCYQQMCIILEDKGVRSDEYLTPREFRLKAVKDLAVSEDTISDLTTVFEESRYSTHELDDDARKRALRDLNNIRGELEV